jgi:hypothetical protein
MDAIRARTSTLGALRGYAQARVLVQRTARSGRCLDEHRQSCSPVWLGPGGDGCWRPARHLIHATDPCDGNHPTGLPTSCRTSRTRRLQQRLLNSWWPAAAQIADIKERVLAENDLLQYRTDNQVKIWTGIVQALGAGVLAIGAYFTWRNLRVASEAQISNRFTQAIGQVGAELKDGQPNLEVRLGGIYALERIARDSPRDHWSIIEVLTA